MTAQVVTLHKVTSDIVSAAGRAIAGQRREVNAELATLRAEIAALREVVDALPNSTQITTALTASKVLGKRYLGEVRRGLAQLRIAADHIDINGEVIREDEFIAAAEGRINGAVAEWYLARSLLPNKITLRMGDGTKPNLGGGRKLTDHLRICLLRTVEHGLGGDPTDVVVRGCAVRMPKDCVALIRQSQDQRAAARGLRGDYRGDARTQLLARLLADARLLLAADHDAVQEVEIIVEDVGDTLVESAQRSEDAALRLAKLYGDVRRAHLSKADGLVPELSGDIEVEFQRQSAEYQNALSDPAVDQGVYRMRHLSDCA